ncbi:CDP-glycerol glycerophosphotransferase family protein [Paenibacillus pinistramenti]|uniref:CDP-glycerol glycerophosphotransferase family protein n=1 Tax=Paenibacillus pinistramenti TaxID=1768003 RepID=UPI0013969D2E|nr:CDP-glycerol glycerophosphotransferase family protein [Paenibacillus pinistramenti]
MNNKKFKPRVKLINHTRAGCNCRALYENIPDFISEKYDVELLVSDFYTQGPEEIVDSEIVVTTHRDYIPTPYQLNIELWHGFGPKTTGAMETTIRSIKNSREYLYYYFKNINMIASYSPFCSAMVNAGFHVTGEAYKVTGMPRNDALFNSKGRDRLQSILNRDISNKKIIYYMPTWRDQYVNLNKSDGGRSWQNIFGIEYFDFHKFEEFLEQNNMLMVVKLHYFEERLVADKVKELLSPSIYFLTEEKLAETDTGTYDILNAADMLISDYSSVYMDFLLLDRPVMFVPSDLEKYNSTRGLWLSPYDFWAPGPIVGTQSDLQSEIIKSITNLDYFKQQRNYVKSIVHHYQDSSSSIRVWQAIDALWEGRDKKGEFLNKSIDDDILLIRNTIKSNINNMLTQGFIDEAAHAIDEYAKEASDDKELLTLKASYHFVNNDIKKAILLLREDYILRPDHPETLFNLGFMYKVEGDIRKSSYYFERLMDAYKNSCTDINEELIEQAKAHLLENDKLFVGVHS